MKKLFKKTPFIALVFAFLFFGQTTVKAQNKSDHVYIKIEVNGMACPYCAFGMEKQLKKVSGVDNVKIQLKEGLAYIATLKKQKPLKESLALIITNAGFTPGKIEYSDKPFVIKDTPKTKE
ncbi:MAG: heavy-metal-associated domain-containing protein [Flavobacteriaceae bacterium]|nr:heavy-metal-associated domain-containing protein [Flavobacteriaceae bacterium]